MFHYNFLFLLKIENNGSNSNCKKVNPPATVAKYISWESFSKMQNYRDTGVKVVWNMIPNFQEVHIYSGQHLDKMTVCRGNDMCSAAPVLPDFNVSVNAIFEKPTLPDAA